MSKKNKKNKSNLNKGNFKSGVKITIGMVPPIESMYLHQLEQKEQLIERFINSDFKAISDDEIRSNLTVILSYDNGNGAYFMPMNVPTHEIPIDSLLFRIRTIDSSIKCEDDLWYPPSKYISKRGRLNDIHESVLYVTGDIGTALGEMRIEVGQEFYLLFYKVINTIGLIDIFPSQGINSKYKEVEGIVSTFLVDEFSTLVPDNGNERYRVSNMIGKFFYNYQKNELDGWRYPSAVRSGKKSIAIDSKKCKEKLKFLFIAKGKLETEINYTLEHPKVLYTLEDKLYLLSELVKTGDIEQYDVNMIKEINTIWSNWS